MSPFNRILKGGLTDGDVSVPRHGTFVIVTTIVTLVVGETNSGSGSVGGMDYTVVFLSCTVKEGVLTDPLG